MGETNPELIIKNLETLVADCAGHISMLSKYRKYKPSADVLVSEYISKISSFKDEWADALAVIRQNGFSPEGRLSYVDVSYSGSYAFVILSGYIKDLCFDLDKRKLLDDYKKFCDYNGFLSKGRK